MAIPLLLIDKIGAKSRATGWLTLISVGFLLTAMMYSAWRLNGLTKQIELKQRVIARQEQEIQALNANVKKTDSYLMHFFEDVTESERVQLLDPTVKWASIQKEIVDLPIGDRKLSLIVALLYAWKEVPFDLGGKKLQSGLDSSNFFRLVLAQSGVKFNPLPGEVPSATMMRSLAKEERPLPGDLAFFRGQTGSFGFLILDPGDEGRAPTGVGALQKIAPLQVLRLDRVNTAYYPLIGYFHVSYPDE